MQTEYFDCSCTDAGHVIRFQYDEEDNELWLSVQMRQWRGFWKRLWVAFKYVLKLPSLYGHWDCWVLEFTDAQRLIDMATVVKEKATVVCSHCGHKWLGTWADHVHVRPWIACPECGKKIVLDKKEQTNG